MIGTKVINLIKTFSNEEIKSFERFIMSPYFNSVKNYVTLFEVIKKFYPEFNDERFTNEYIFKKLFKGKPFNKQVMWNITSGLEKLAVEFLIHKSLELNNYYKHSLLLLDLSSRNLPGYYKSKLNDFEEYSNSLLIGEDLETGTDYFKAKWKTSTLNGVYAQILDRLEMIKEIPAERSGYLLCSFIQHLTQDVYNIHFFEKTYNFKCDSNIPLLIIKQLNLSKLIEDLKTKRFDYVWILEFYYFKIMCLLENDNELHFNNFRRVFVKNYKKFLFSEKYNSISTLTNYCLEKISAGKLKYRVILFEINKFRLNENLFVTAKVFRKTLYMQILNTALSIEKIEWTKNFVAEYTKYLNKDAQLSVKSLAMANINFIEKKYSDVLDTLKKVEFIDITDKIDVKNLTARTYYEMKEYDALLYHIESTRHFLSDNKKISSAQKERNIKFYNSLKKLTLSREKNDKENLKALYDKVFNDITLIHKNWFEKKINEIKQ